jgi:hypothetical protein
LSWKRASSQPELFAGAELPIPGLVPTARLVDSGPAATEAAVATDPARAVWFYTQGSADVGPVSFEQLQAVVGRGQLGPEELVWCAGMADWAPAGSIQGLYPGGASAPAAGGRFAGLHEPAVSITAVASLALGLVWLFWIGSLLAIVLGMIALAEIKHNRGRLTGEGLAVSGIAIGGAGLCYLVVGIIAQANDVDLPLIDVVWPL